MSTPILPTELSFFCTLAAAGSLSAAGRTLGLSTPGVSKRLAAMEARLGLRLVARTTRRMALTSDGELYLQHARRILGEIDDMARLLGAARGEPQGLLRLGAPAGWGRAVLAPLLPKLARAHPQLQIQLSLHSATPPALAGDGQDLLLRYGAPTEPQVASRRLLANHWLLVASPAYLARQGTPVAPADLARHSCLAVLADDGSAPVWRLRGGRGAAVREELVTPRGALGTGDAEAALHWALAGHGVLRVAACEVAKPLASGRLVAVLPGWQGPEADLHAVWPLKHQQAARVRSAVAFLAQALSR